VAVKAISIAGLSLLFAGLATGSPAARDLSLELATADALMRDGRFEQAYGEYERFARSNPLAQFNLGLIDRNGWGRSPDPVAACRWFEQASAGQIPMAQQMLGDCYRLGIHAPASQEMAIQWYSAAAANGLPMANCLAGKVMIEDQHGQNNREEGLRRCEAAGQAGAVEAQLYLGHIYRTGDAVEQNIQRARYWYDRSAGANNAEGLYQLGLLVREELPARRSREKALYLLESSAAKGYQPAYLATAELYFQSPVEETTGLPGAANLAKSYMWLQATIRSRGDPGDTERARQMLGAVEAIMPNSWKADLDEEVDAHFRRFHPDA
jgi:TPR repeat protein